MADFLKFRVRVVKVIYKLGHGIPRDSMLKYAKAAGGEVWRGGIQFRALSSAPPPPPTPPPTTTHPPRTELFHALKLNRFSDTEIAASYQLVFNESASSSLQQARLNELVLANKLLPLSSTSAPKNPTQEEWRKAVITLAEKLDPRVYPLGISFLGTGLSIGIIVPVLPLLVESLKISPSEFGFVVSAFAIGKLVGNIPCARWVEVVGRKSVLIGGMCLCSVGIGSIGLAVDPNFGVGSLIISRLITGFGVSAFTAAAFVMLTDISTALNRTRTIAPVMASFQAGTALGPALGGLAVTSLGIAQSYYLVGSMIGLLSLGNHLYLRDTVTLKTEMEAVAIPQPGNPPGHHPTALRTAITAWTKLLKQPAMRDVVLANTAYWVGLSGTNLTLLPLFMVGPDLHLTATQIGLCFAFSSSVSVLMSQPIAYLADKWGKEKCIFGGLGVLGTSMALLPTAATSFESLIFMLAPVALGSTCLSAVPTALVGDFADPGDRSQALALLRTAGDVGLLVGAIFSGLVSSLSSIPLTMEVNGALLLLSGAAWGIRRL